MPGKQNGPVTAEGGRGRMSFDPEDPEYIKDLQRPAVIKEDLNEMERRKRVHQILESKPFRQELEQLIKQEKDHGNNPENLKTLEQLSELILPKGQLAAASLHGINSQAIVPIADIRGADLGKYSKEERFLRNKLAALYRLIDLFQWSQGIYNHVTLRVGDSEEVLINPFGLLYHEISAATLVKMDLSGHILDSGSTGMGVNSAGAALHSAIHRTRPDVRCIIHLHTPVVGAVSAMKCGLLPISQEAIIVGEVSTHDYHGIVEKDEQEAIIRDLKPNSKVMLLRNHGCVACGASVEEALHLAYNLVLACETQIRAARAGIENLVIPSEDAQRRTKMAASNGGGGVLRSPERGRIKWRVGELEWEAWMRVLDNAGFRTGHFYRQPIFKKGLERSRQSEVAEPPSATSYGELEEADSVNVAASRLDSMRREQERTRWLNSPNVYQKVEFLESGTSDPKKITKWVQDATSPMHSTPVKISDLHQFSPIAANSKEFKSKQKEIKENRREGQISAGPQSHVLDGVTYEEMAQMNRDADMSGTSEGLVLIGTASKGIIERDFQHNAQVYRQLYAPNPFASETDEDIQKYMAEVQAKQVVDKQPGPASPTETESPTAGFTRETTFDATPTAPSTRITEKRQASSIGGVFGRSKSERTPSKSKEKSATLPAQADSRGVASDDETNVDGKSPKKKDKKKKGWTPSFLRSKKDKKGRKEEEV